VQRPTMTARLKIIRSAVAAGKFSSEPPRPPAGPETEPEREPPKNCVISVEMPAKFSDCKIATTATTHATATEIHRHLRICRSVLTDQRTSAYRPRSFQMTKAYRKSSWLIGTCRTVIDSSG